MCISREKIIYCANIDHFAFYPNIYTSYFVVLTGDSSSTSEGIVRAMEITVSLSFLMTEGKFSWCLPIERDANNHLMGSV